jgi:hypothetical protein
MAIPGNEKADAFLRIPYLNGWSLKG